MRIIYLLLWSVNIPAEHCTVQQVSVCFRVLIWHCLERLCPQVQKVFLLKRQKLQNPVSCLLLILTNLNRYVLPHFQKYLVPVCRLRGPGFNKQNYKTVWEFKSSGMWCCVMVSDLQHFSASWYLHLQVWSSQRRTVNTGESMAIYRCSGNISSWRGGHTGWRCAGVFLQREPLHTKSCRICHHK